MPKIVKGGPLGFFNFNSVAKSGKNEGGPLETLVNFGKSLIVPKKIKKGDHLVSSGSVGYDKKENK